MTSQRARTRDPDAGSAPAPPYGWALAAGAAVFALYALTLAPTTQYWDASEYIATAHILGIPHPPGNPLFVLLARAWEVLLAPLGLSAAVRINLFSAFMSAGAHALWFLVVEHVLRRFGGSRAFRLVGASAAVLVSATAFTVWNQSNVNEKVYTVSLLTIALLTWLVFRWRERLGRGREDHLLVLCVFLLALSVGNHLMAFLAAPAIALFVLLVDPRAVLRWRLWPAFALAAVLGLSVHLFLPIRAGLDPVINNADPTCESLGDAVTSVVTYGRRGCPALSEALTREQFIAPGEPGAGTVERQAPVHVQLVNYLQYFDWQWARSLQPDRVLFAGARLPFTLLFALLGVWGAIEHARRDRPSFLYFVALFGTLSLGLVLYLNFKYGYSIPDPEGRWFDSAVHEVRERDYFFIASFSVWGLWVGMGLAALWRRLAAGPMGPEEDGALRQRPGRANLRPASLLRASPVLALALVPLALNWSWADRSDDYSARDWAYNLLMSVEPYGVLFTVGDNDTFPLWYLQEVEGVRQDVTVVVSMLLRTTWYGKHLRDLSRPCPPGTDPGERPTRIVCQRPYDAGAEAIYTASPGQVADGRVALALREPVEPPSRPIHTLDDATVDRVAGSYFRLDGARELPMGNIRASLADGQLVFPEDQIGLRIITDSLTERPIHFSSQSAAEQLGLGDYLVRQGVSFRLHDGELPDTAPPGFVRMPEGWAPAGGTGRWVDEPRTRALLDRVFVHRSGLPDWEHWKDRPSIGIPQYYAWGYLALAQAAHQEGRRQEAVRYEDRAQRWFALGS